MFDKYSLMIFLLISDSDLSVRMAWWMISMPRTLATKSEQDIVRSSEKTLWSRHYSLVIGRIKTGTRSWSITKLRSQCKSSIFCTYKTVGRKRLFEDLTPWGESLLHNFKSKNGRGFQPMHKTRNGQFLWTYVSMKNTLLGEAYTGVLNNHRSEAKIRLFNPHFPISSIL